jgi:PIN domain nuclease of toxin-antitoxin system
VNLLLDTHIALWALTDDKNLPAAARELIADGGNRVFVSVASMWEIAIKRALKPEKIPLSGREFLHYCGQAGYEFLSIKDSHVLALEGLPSIHADPFDRILVAQAEADNLILLTHDSLLQKYGRAVMGV